ncbi:MAG: tetratricopeptide repeat protein [Gallionellaceae bacterium]|nr:tetratricopeptide repeat protein [Gallionellaceae bacterium]
MLASLFNQGRYPEAATLARTMTARFPLHGFGWMALGAALKQMGQTADALVPMQKAAALSPDDADAHSNLGVTLQELGRLSEAEASLRRALQINAGNAAAYNNLGNVLQDLGRPGEAENSYRQALRINPDYAQAYYNLGKTLQELGRPNEAETSYRQALQISPDYAKAHNNLGVTLKELGRSGEAEISLRRALQINPDYAEAHSNLGATLKELGRLDEAEASYRRALQINPDLADAHNNLGVVLNDLGRLDEAEASYRRALQINPDYAFLYGSWLHTKQMICDWSALEDQFAQLAGKIEHGEKATMPFQFLVISNSLALQRKAAEIWVQAKYPASNALPEIAGCFAHDKIRIGYFSADFHNHATAYLMAELFERHDKSRFELTAFSFGPDSDDDMRRRLVAAFDNFIDVRRRSDKEVAMLARSMEIDIAVDLKGFTKDSRVGIFSMRAAPLQVNYLGYPGTMGAEYIDYLIADPTLIPESHKKGYAEKIAYLPYSYQVNDAKRRIADKKFTRAELGLPETGFVFCCFNNNYKITPNTFDCWMRILKQVEDSVLWLLEGNATAAANLSKEAELRGVNAARLVFAKRMPIAEHLARHRLADLFLDTLPCNAHTTASDALWAGLPVLTCLGETFAGRVAASLLNAIHLPELITPTPEAYEALAIELAENHGKLSELKQQLANNRLATPLFDTQLFTRHIEAAYTAMYERYQAGLAPEHIHVQP